MDSEITLRIQNFNFAENALRQYLDIVPMAVAWKHNKKEAVIGLLSFYRLEPTEDHIRHFVDIGNAYLAKRESAS